jgi:two-component system, NarL family, sensor histidine kinase DesK
MRQPSREKNAIVSLVIFFSILLPFFPAHSQDTIRPACFDISKERLADTLSTGMQIAYLSKDSSLQEHYSQLHFDEGGSVGNRKVQDKNVPRRVIIRFNVCNSADTEKGVFFFPGFYFNHIDLYRAEGSSLKKLPYILPYTPDSIGYRYFSLSAGDSATIVAELTMEKTYNNIIRPRLINELYLPAYIVQVHSATDRIDMMTYLVCGLFLMMILFSFAGYLSGGSEEFLYYSLYGLMIGAMLFSKSFYNNHTIRINYFIESYLDFVLQSIGIIFYLIFMQKFLDAKKKHPFLFQIFNAGVFVLILSISFFSIVHFFSDNFSLKNNIETFTKFFLTLILVPVVIVYSIRNWPDKILRYIAWGNFCMLIFSVFSQSLIIFGKFPQTARSLLSNSLFFYEIGLLLEFIFFLIALSYKNRRQLIEKTRESERLKIENQLKEYEKELAVYKAQQEERDRISADMHDELGSGMTAIRLMSEIAKNKMKENTPREIEKISESADDVLNKMNAIIWTMNSSNDTVDNLVSYIRSYTLEYFENTPIACKINTPEKIEAMELRGDKRRNIFLCIKETFNNALKYSQADVITVDLEVNETLKVRIADNGIGIDLNNLRQFGNGIQNIRRRMEKIGGTADIKNENGTVTLLELPLN